MDLLVKLSPLGCKQNAEFKNKLKADPPPPMAAHSSVLAWRIPGRGEPGGLPSVGSHTTEVT